MFKDNGSDTSVHGSSMEGAIATSVGTAASASSVEIKQEISAGAGLSVKDTDAKTLTDALAAKQPQSEERIEEVNEAKHIIRQISVIISRQTDNTEIAQVMNILIGFSTDPELQADVTNLREKIIQILTKYRNDITIVRHCAATLANLTINEDARLSIKHSIMNTDAIPVMLEALKVRAHKFVDNISIFAALVNLECSKQIIDKNGIPILLNLIDSNVENAEIIIISAQIIRNFAQVPSSIPLIIKEGTVTVLTAALKKHSQTKMVAEQLAETLKFLARDPDANIKIAQSACTSLLIDSLQCFSNDKSSISAFVSAIEVLAENMPEDIKTKAINILSTVSKLHSDNGQVTLALSKLQQSLSSLTEATAINKRDSHLIKTIFSLLQNKDTAEKAAEKIKTNIPLIIRVIAHSDDLSLVNSALSILHYAATDLSTLSEILNHADKLNQALMRHTDNVIAAEHVASIIENYTQKFERVDERHKAALSNLIIGLKNYLAKFSEIKENTTALSTATAFFNSLERPSDKPEEVAHNWKIVADFAKDEELIAKATHNLALLAVTAESLLAIANTIDIDQLIALKDQYKTHAAIVQYIGMILTEMANSPDTSVKDKVAREANLPQLIAQANENSPAYPYYVAHLNALVSLNAAPELVAQATDKVTQLTENDEKLSDITEIGGIPTLCKAIIKYQADPRIFGPASHALLKLVLNNTSSWQTLMSEEGVNSILLILSKSCETKNDIVASGAMFVLANLARHSDCRDVMFTKGIVKVLINVMQTYKHNADILTNAAGTFANLSLDLEAVPYIATKQTVDLMLSLLELHPDNENLSSAIWQFLSSIPKDYLKPLKTISERFIFAAKFVLDHSNNQVIVQNAARCLRNSTTWEDSSKILAKTGAIDSLIRAEQTNPNNLFIVASTWHVLVETAKQDTLLLALVSCHLAIHAENPQELAVIARTAGISNLISLITHDNQDPNVVVFACQVLAKLAGNADNHAEIIKLGGKHALLVGLGTLAGFYPFIKTVSGAIRDLASAESAGKTPCRAENTTTVGAFANEALTIGGKTHKPLIERRKSF